jgi:hypothetical protein
MRAVGSIVAIAVLASTAAQAQPAYPADWDKRIGDDFWTRLINYYALEW